MKTITVEANGATMDVTRDQIKVNIHFARSRLAALNRERSELVKKLRMYKSDLDKFDDKG